MSGKNEETTRKYPHEDGYAGSPATQQIGAVGQRRRDAEQKLEHHLEEARHKDDRSDGDAADDGKAGQGDSPDVAAVQNDDRLTAADRVDLIANQIIPNDDAGGTPGTGNAP